MSYVTNLALCLQYFNKLTYLLTHTLMAIRLQEKCIWPNCEFDLWPLTLKTCLAMRIHMMNIYEKFHWNPPSNLREIVWRGVSVAHWRRNCSVDHTATHTTGNSSIDTSVTRDTQRPWSFCKTCDVAMKFVDDDDDDDLVVFNSCFYTHFVKFSCLFSTSTNLGSTSCGFKVSGGASTFKCPRLLLM